MVFTKTRFLQWTPVIKYNEIIFLFSLYQINGHRANVLNKRGSGLMKKGALPFC